MTPRQRDWCKVLLSVVVTAGMLYIGGAGVWTAVWKRAWGDCVGATLMLLFGITYVFDTINTIRRINRENRWADQYFDQHPPVNPHGEQDL